MCWRHYFDLWTWLSFTWSWILGTGYEEIRNFTDWLCSGHYNCVWLVGYVSYKKKCHLIDCFVLLVWNELLNCSYTFKNCWKYIKLGLFFSVFTLWSYWNILKVSFLKVSIKLALFFFLNINPCTDSFREWYNTCTTNDYQENLVGN